MVIIVNSIYALDTIKKQEKISPYTCPHNRIVEVGKFLFL
jgi:hypothetical protein